MKKLMITGCALALGVVWTVAPASAQESTKDKIERKTDRAVDKVEDTAKDAKDKIKEESREAKDKVKEESREAKDKVKDTTHNTKDKVSNKTESTTDKVKDTARDTKDKISEKSHEAKDKISEKSHEAKDKITDKTHRANDRVDRMARQDVRTAQQSLQAKGYDPGPIDGIHGPRTSAAVRKFQQTEGLEATGRLDSNTVAKLNGSASVGSPSALPASTTPEAQSTPPPAQPGAVKPVPRQNP